MELVTFMLFSTIEVLTVFIFMMVLYRENPMEFIWQALSVSVLMGMQSHFLRGLDLGFLAVVINLMFYVLILATIVRLPILWSIIISGSGFFPYGVAQALLFEKIGGELLQLVTSILFLIASYLLYKFGLGIEAPYQKLKLPREKAIVVTVIITAFVLTAITMYVQESWANILFFGGASALFLYYAFRKDREAR
ncbi:hypothetical protein [Paenibacillus sp. UASWS1643]|uniref:hypothetical protein n=1 Tax=Paenibacillus sp. UASWS1643 TaxID=2580422 RepID=UPI00123886B9|nr:hypothetical protein [Paenibacillus sp. UASWS1643]KAA8750077.1 hypothetical protein FE296_15880 [Paenibacillus sp. UASWS1643]